MLERFRRKPKENEPAKGWKYCAREWTYRPSLYGIIEPPSWLVDPPRTEIWRARGYGLWPVEIVRENSNHLEITQKQTDLHKSTIASILISDDRNKFSTLPDNDPIKAAFRVLALANDSALNERTKNLELYFGSKIGLDHGSALSKEFITTTTRFAVDFVRACERKEGDLSVNRQLIINQVFAFMNYCDQVNKSLPVGGDIVGDVHQKPLEDRGIMSLQSPAVSGSE